MIKQLDLINMKIFMIFSIMVIVILFIGKNLIYSAKRNIFKNQAAWSGKDIKIKYNNTIEVTESNDNENFLKLIADESKIYLENESKEDE